MKEFYTIIDCDGFPIKFEPEGIANIAVRKVSLNQCEEYASLNQAKSGLSYINKVCESSAAIIYSGRLPFKISKVITIRQLIEI